MASTSYTDIERRSRQNDEQWKIESGLLVKPLRYDFPPSEVKRTVGQNVPPTEEQAVHRAIDGLRGFRLNQDVIEQMKLDNKTWKELAENENLGNRFETGAVGDDEWAIDDAAIFDPIRRNEPAIWLPDEEKVRRRNAGEHVQLGGGIYGKDAMKLTIRKLRAINPLTKVRLSDEVIALFLDSGEEEGDLRERIEEGVVRRIPFVAFVNELARFWADPNSEWVYGNSDPQLVVNAIAIFEELLEDVIHFHFLVASAEGSDATHVVCVITTDGNISNFVGSDIKEFWGQMDDYIEMGLEDAGPWFTTSLDRPAESMRKHIYPARMVARSLFKNLRQNPNIPETEPPWPWILDFYMPYIAVIPPFDQTILRARILTISKFFATSEFIQLGMRNVVHMNVRDVTVGFKWIIKSESDVAWSPNDLRLLEVFDDSFNAEIYDVRKSGCVGAFITREWDENLIVIESDLVAPPVHNDRKINVVFYLDAASADKFRMLWVDTSSSSPISLRRVYPAKIQSVTDVVFGKTAGPFFYFPSIPAVQLFHSIFAKMYANHLYHEPKIQIINLERYTAVDDKIIIKDSAGRPVMDVPFEPFYRTARLSTGLETPNAIIELHLGEKFAPFSFDVAQKIGWVLAIPSGTFLWRHKPPNKPRSNWIIHADVKQYQPELAPQNVNYEVMQLVDDKFMWNPLGIGAAGRALCPGSIYRTYEYKHHYMLGSYPSITLQKLAEELPSVLWDVADTPNATIKTYSKSAITFASGPYPQQDHEEFLHPLTLMSTVLSVGIGNPYDRYLHREEQTGLDMYLLESGEQEPLIISTLTVTGKRLIDYPSSFSLTQFPPSPPRLLAPSSDVEESEVDV